MGARAPATEVRLAPSSRGRLGAWLLVGPYRSATFGSRARTAPGEALALPPPGVDEATLDPRAGVPVPVSAVNGAAAPGRPPRAVPAWTIASSGDGAVDVKGALKATEADVIAYAAGTLHVERAGRFYLLLGADDGVRLSIDGRAVFTRDDARPQRDDDDLVAVDLGAGDHALLLKLHQRDGAWKFTVRVVDAELAPPAGAYLALPGTTADDARDLATKLSWISVDRGLVATGYRPTLTARFPEGAPRGVPLRVRARLSRTARPDDRVFDVDAGEVPVDAAGADDLVVTLPSLGASDLARVEDADWTYELTVAGRAVRAPFFPRRTSREAVAHADRALAALETEARVPWLRDGSRESVRALRDRMARLVGHGDADGEAQRAEARELDGAATSLEARVDPYERRTGAMRRAYRSPADGELAEYGLYVPPSYRPETARLFPLVVALHGLNGRPMAMMRWFFGGDDPDKEQDWEDRHTSDLPPLEAFVVTPGGHGNAMYRDLGEDDVMRVMDAVMAAYPIDRSRVSITGPSMGGIGTAAIAFRHPDRFAAAAPLCGYHSYFVRRDVIGRPMRPWERLLAEERSNVEWAANGAALPLWIVHGTQDLPEANSGVLIDRYEKLGFSVKHDHPALGHNVWQTTYEGLKAARWLTTKRRDAHPASVAFRTVRLRDADDAWVHVDELATSDAWGEIQAHVRTRSAIDVTTRGVRALRLDRDEKLVDPAGAISVVVDGARLTFAAGEPLAMYTDGARWTSGVPRHDGPWKHGEITGPLRDAFHAPLLFVYGTDDPSQSRANEEVARAWALVRWGVTVHYPIMSDAEFLARGEPLANDRALFLVGNARSNRVLRDLEADLPIRIDGDAVVIGAQRIEGKQLGAAFVRPNPRRPDRYLVVVEGVDALGTWRSLSLPDLLPDFVVYDEQVAPARGQILLSAGLVRAAGFFGSDWSLPARLDDPLATTLRPAARSEYDATPYLP
jgi:poly(3-hydroxybutyrate) depolymerase